MKRLTFQEFMNKNPPKEILIREDADTDRLYGSLDNAIKYLGEVRKKLPTANLEEHWHGYEDMTMVFSYVRVETSQEYNQRMRSEFYLYGVQLDKLEKDKKIKEKTDKIKALQKEIASL